MLTSLRAEVSACREAERRRDAELDISRRELADDRDSRKHARCARREAPERRRLQRLVAALASDVEALKAAQAREAEGLNLRRRARWKASTRHSSVRPGDIAALRRELAESYRRIDDLHDPRCGPTAVARAVYEVLRGR